MYVYPDTTIQFWGLYFVNSNTGFVSGSAGTILKTTNKGDNWNLLTSPTISALDGIYFVNENTGYIGGSGSGILIKTTDAGVSFVNKNGLYISGFETATAIYFSDVNNGMYCTNAGRIVMTTNGGDNWSLIYSMSGGIWGMSFPNATTGFACTSTGTVLKTTNFGASWGVQNTPLTENLYEICFSSAQTGYIATWSGKVLKTTNAGLTFTSGINTGVPDKFILYQNYPNPFNPTTVIRYQLSVVSDVSLKVYDILGKEIATLVNEKLQSGTYEVPFSNDQLPSGIYFYTLTAGDYKETKRMTLIK